jgi:hypothetical protein
MKLKVATLKDGGQFAVKQMTVDLERVILWGFLTGYKARQMPDGKLVGVKLKMSEGVTVDREKIESMEEVEVTAFLLKKWMMQTRQSRVEESV